MTDEQTPKDRLRVAVAAAQGNLVHAEKIDPDNPDAGPQPDEDVQAIGTELEAAYAAVEPLIEAGEAAQETEPVAEPQPDAG